MTTTELLHRVPEVINESATDSFDAVIQYQLEEPVYHQISAGKVSAVTGTHGSPDVTVVVSEDNIRKLLRGDLRLSKAVFTGKLRVRGDLLLARRLLGLIDREALARILDEASA